MPNDFAELCNVLSNCLTALSALRTALFNAGLFSISATERTLLTLLSRMAPKILDNIPSLS